MNQNQVCVCDLILQKIISRPIAKMFWDINEVTVSLNEPLSLSIIEEKLHRGLYTSATHWVSDMRELFSSGFSKKTEHTLRMAAARQLMEELNKLLWELSPMQCSTVIKFELIENQLNQFISNNLPSFRIQGETSDREPCAFPLKRKPKGNEEIAEYMKLITSPSLILRALSFLSFIQPEVVQINEESLCIVFSLMYPETSEKFGEYLHKLTTESASGKFDPYFQDVQSKVKPAIPIVNHYERFI